MVSLKDVHELCKRCKNFNDISEESFDCYSKKCPSTDKHIKVDSWGPDKSRTPTWIPTE